MFGIEISRVLYRNRTGNRVFKILPKKIVKIPRNSSKIQKNSKKIKKKLKKIVQFFGFLRVSQVVWFSMGFFRFLRFMRVFVSFNGFSTFLRIVFGFFIYFFGPNIQNPVFYPVPVNRMPRPAQLDARVTNMTEKYCAHQTANKFLLR